MVKKQNPPEPRKSSGPLRLILAITAITILAIMIGVSVVADRPTTGELLYHREYRRPSSGRLSPNGTGELSGLQRNAFEAYEGGDFKHAIKLLEAAWHREQDTVSLLYLGISYLERDRLTRAREAMQAYEKLVTDQMALDRSRYLRFLIAVRESDRARADSIALSIRDENLSGKVKKILDDWK